MPTPKKEWGQFLHCHIERLRCRLGLRQTIPQKLPAHVQAGLVDAVAEAFADVPARGDFGRGQRGDRFVQGGDRHHFI